MGFLHGPHAFAESCLHELISGTTPCLHLDVLVMSSLSELLPNKLSQHALTANGRAVTSNAIAPVSMLGSLPVPAVHPSSNWPMCYLCNEQV